MATFGLVSTKHPQDNIAQRAEHVAKVVGARREQLIGIHDQVRPNSECPRTRAGMPSKACFPGILLSVGVLMARIGVMGTLVRCERARTISRTHRCVSNLVHSRGRDMSGSPWQNSSSSQAASTSSKQCEAQMRAKRGRRAPTCLISPLSSNGASGNAAMLNLESGPASADAQI